MNPLTAARSAAHQGSYGHGGATERALTSAWVSPQPSSGTRQCQLAAPWHPARAPVPRVATQGNSTRVSLRLSELDTQSAAQQWDTLWRALITHEEPLCATACFPGFPQGRAPTQVALPWGRQRGLQSWAEKTLFSDQTALPETLWRNKPSQPRHWLSPKPDIAGIVEQMPPVPAGHGDNQNAHVSNVLQAVLSNTEATGHMWLLSIWSYNEAML